LTNLGGLAGHVHRLGRRLALLGLPLGGDLAVAAEEEDAVPVRQPLEAAAVRRPRDLGVGGPVMNCRYSSDDVNVLKQWQTRPRLVVPPRRSRPATRWSRRS
jgi:hypothetical protein